MKVAIAPMVWKRPKVFDVFAEGVEQLKKRFNDVEFTFICVGSEGEESKRRVEDKGFIYHEHPNHPLSNKGQYRLEKVRELDVDYWLSLSDDDFCTPSYFAFILDKMYQGYEYIAPYDIYYIRNGQLFYSFGYPKEHRRSGEPLAIGRCVSTKLLDRLDWNLWGDGTHDRGLDKDAYNKLDSEAQSKYYFNCRDIGGMVVDIKSTVNKTPWNPRGTYHYITDDLYTLFPYEICKLIEDVPHQR